MDPTKGVEARAFAARINADASATAPAADSATENPDIPEQIKKLGELRDSGLLTDAEFEAKEGRAARPYVRLLTGEQIAFNKHPMVARGKLGRCH